MMSASIDTSDTWLDELQRDYAETRTPIRWPLPDELREALAVTLRDRFAEKLSRDTPENIALRYVYLTSDQMDQLVRMAESNFMPHPLRGIGIEVGAGCGVLAAVVANRPSVKMVLALEVCEKIAELLIPRVSTDVLGDDANKVLPIVGSFDDLKIPDESLDFAIDNDSLHHSDDLARTLVECSRVLKPGGLLLCFDRCHDDSVSDEEVQRLLSKVYPRRFLAANGYPPDIKLTRGENGEHEYRLFEWRAAAVAADLEMLGKHDVVRRESGKKAIKGVLSLLPKFVRDRIYKSNNANLKSTLKWAKQFAKQAIHPAHCRRTLAPKKTTILVFQKRSSRRASRRTSLVPN